LAVNLQARLFATFAVVIALAAGALTWMHVRNARFLLGAITDDLQSIGSTVRLSTQSLSSEKGTDRAALEAFVREASAQKNVRAVHVIGKDRTIVASSDPGKVGSAGGPTGREIVVSEELGAADSAAGRIRYQVRVPILRDHHVIGVVQTSVLLRDFRELVRRTLVRDLAVALSALLVALFASSWLLRRLSEPVRTLAAAAESVAGGDLSVRLPVRNPRDEAGRLHAAFNVMVGRLAERRALEDKLHSLERQALVAEMSASLAHEIRNPLNLINLTAGHLGDAYAPADASRRAEYDEMLRSLRAEVQHLNDVVHRFLALGRPGRLVPETFAAEGLLEETRLLIRPQLLAKGVELRISAAPGAALRADKGQVRLLLLNLLLNAADASPPGGVIEAEALTRAGWTLLRVRDQGPGIPEADRERVFNAYHTGKPAGVGLGLALVRRIAEEHGGEARVLAPDASEGGALFEVRLPGGELG
jgi:signal transduction histidine kinase